MAENALKGAGGGGGGAGGGIGDFLEFTRAFKDLARQNRYDVKISGVGPTTMPDNISKMVMNVNQGSSSVSTTQWYGNLDSGRYYSNLPYDLAYDPIQLTLYIDSEWKSYDYFDKWMKKVYNDKTGANGYYNDVIGTVEISSVDRKDIIGPSNKYEGCVLTGITKPQFDNTSQNAVATFSVNIQYRTCEFIK